MIATRGHLRGAAVMPTPRAPLTELPRGRRCQDCGGPLNMYNAGPCGPCVKRAEDRRIASITGPTDTHEQRKARVLAHLETGACSSPQLAGLMGCALLSVQYAVADLVKTGRVEVAANNRDGYRLTNAGGA